MPAGEHGHFVGPHAGSIDGCFLVGHQINAFSPRRTTQRARTGMGRGGCGAPTISNLARSLHSPHGCLYQDSPLRWLEGHLGARQPENVTEAPTEGSRSPVNAVPWSPQGNQCKTPRELNWGPLHRRPSLIWVSPPDVCCLPLPTAFHHCHGRAGAQLFSIT